MRRLLRLGKVQLTVTGEEVQLGAFYRSLESIAKCTPQEVEQYDRPVQEDIDMTQLTSGKRVFDLPLQSTLEDAIIEMSQQFPELKFVAAYINEEECFRGILSCKNGRIIEVESSESELSETETQKLTNKQPTQTTNIWQNNEDTERSR